MTLKAPVAILVNLKPGYSDYHLGQQLKTYLEAKGETVNLYAKETLSPFNYVYDQHLVCFYTDIVWPHYKYSKFRRPKSVLHIQCIGPNVYPEHEYLAYLGTLMHEKMNGIPVAHMNVSPSTEKEFRHRVTKYFAPSFGREILKKATTNCYGIEPGFKIHGDPDPDSLVAPYNRWEVGQKNLSLHMELSQTYKTYQESKNRKYEQVFYYNKDAFDPKELPPRAHDVFTFKDQFYDRPSFKENIGQHGMFLSTSTRESFGLYFLELLMAGSVGVFQSYPWIETLLPNYPFIVPGNDLLGTMTWVRDNYEEARKMSLAHAVPYINAHYSQQKYLDGIYDIIVQLEKQGKEAK